MGIFEQFPYTNYHDANLDWFISKWNAFANMIAEKEQEWEQQETDFEQMQSDFAEIQAEWEQIQEDYDSVIAGIDTEIAGGLASAKAEMQAQYDEFLETYQEDWNVVQTTGQSTEAVMSQKAVTDQLANKANTTDIDDEFEARITQTTGTSTTKIMSQNAVTGMIEDSTGASTTKGYSQNYINNEFYDKSQTDGMLDLKINRAEVASDYIGYDALEQTTGQAVRKVMSQSAITSALNTKANQTQVDGINTRLTQAEASISGKANQTQVDSLAQDMTNKADTATVTALANVVATKADESELDDFTFNEPMLVNSANYQTYCLDVRSLGNQTICFDSDIDNTMVRNMPVYNKAVTIVSINGGDQRWYAMDSDNIVYTGNLNTAGTAIFWTQQATIDDVEEADIFENSLTHTEAQKRQAIDNIAVYDTLIQAYKITDPTTTMGDVQTFLNGVNSNNDVMMFNLSALADGFYLCSIYLGAGYYRIADMVTGFLKTGFFKTTDLLADILTSAPVSTGKHYTVEWDKALAQCTRLNDASSITTDTTNFGHFGSVNVNYNNPFDDIYPWSGRKLCNVDIPTYMALTSGDNIEDCVVAWEGDNDFDYNHQYGVWVYTPGFFGRRYEMGNKLYFDVSDELTQYNKEYKASIVGRWNGVQSSLTISGTTKTVVLPLAGERQICDVAMSTQHTYAKNYGGSLIDIYALDPTLLLYIVEYANFNTQLKLGNSVSSIYVADLHASANVVDSDTVTFESLPATSLGRMRVGAEVMIGTGSAGAQIGVRVITAVSTSGTTTTVTLNSAISFTTNDYFTIRGMINTADDDIGSNSGYIGTNGYAHSYYRGECLWGNKWQYILGAYHQATTHKLYVAEEGTTDDYDAINTTAHIDTGVTLADTTSYIKSFGFIDGMNMSLFATETGSSYSANPVGDYFYAGSTSNTVLLLGGYSNFGASAGAFSGHWANGSSNANWHISSRPRLKNP